jgi:hypothetical protein
MHRVPKRYPSVALAQADSSGEPSTTSPRLPRDMVARDEGYALVRIVAYWVAGIGALALLIVDIVDDMTWTNYGTIALIVIAVLIRPGGIRGPR